MAKEKDHQLVAGLIPSCRWKISGQLENNVYTVGPLFPEDQALWTTRGNALSSQVQVSSHRLGKV